jgi:membrane fusion protein
MPASVQGGERTVTTTPLFRPEVLDAKQAQYLGSVRIGRNPSFAVVAGTALSLAASLVSFVVWGEVTRKARVPGLVVPTHGTL